jgi:4-carboxymuconolactone decarboxylase
MSEITEQGLEFYSEVRGVQRADQLRHTIHSGGFEARLVALAIEFCYGTIWTRPGLDRKQRSLVTLGVLIALRETDELKGHVRAGLTNGLTVNEIEEVLIHAAAYAGFPAAYAACKATTEVLRAPDLVPHAMSPKDAPST